MLLARGDRVVIVDLGETWVCSPGGGRCSALAVAALTAPAPAHAEGVFVEVNPSTIQAGFQVAIRASCGDALNNAKVHSEAFGTVTVEPVNVYLIAAATVPEHTRGRRLQREADLPEPADRHHHAVGGQPRQPEHGPNTGGGALAGDSGATLIGAGAAAIGLGLGVLLLSRRRGRSPLTPA